MKTKIKWEEEFDKEYNGCSLGFDERHSEANKKDLKSFIKKLLKKQRPKDNGKSVRDLT